MSENRRPASQRTGTRNSGGARPPQRRRRRRRVNYRFYIFLVIVALLAVGCGVLVNYLVNRPSGNDNIAAVTPDPNNQLLSATDDPSTDIVKAASTSAADIAELLGNQDAVIQGLTEDQQVKVEDLSITAGLDESWMNVLLLGSDARTVNESSRTDTMIICSVNVKSGQVKLTSIMRDTGVVFDNLGEALNGTYRINAANYFGGPKLAMQTINECFGMNIQYYVMVDFTSFSVIAEKLGGIDITITEAEMEHINKNAIQQAKLAYKAGIDESELDATNVKLTQFGENVHLNGRQTLAYARIRKIDSDFSRAERQRTVLVALMDKVKTKSAQEVLSLALTLSSYINTNLSVDQIINVATTVLASGVENVEQFRLPVNKSYVQEERNKQDMLYDTDWAENARQLYSFIYE